MERSGRDQAQVVKYSLLSSVSITLFEVFDF